MIDLSMSDSPHKQHDPNHIGIIMDGNGRWAKERGYSRPRGHREGAKSCRKIIDACRALDVRYLTLYAFSAENWNRPTFEVRALMELLEVFLERETKTMIERGIRLRAIGRIDQLPGRAHGALQRAIDATARFDEWNLTLALNYSSRLEVLDAAKALGLAIARGDVDPEQLRWEDLSCRLYTRDLPDPDLIIRTSGETRLSNFLLMQSAYSEFYFTKVYWPDFDRPHLEEAIAAYRCRERRYGKTGEQLSQPAGARSA